MRMVVYECQYGECNATFAVDADTSHITSEITCPGCGATETEELGEADVEFEANAK